MLDQCRRARLVLCAPTLDFASSGGGREGRSCRGLGSGGTRWNLWSRGHAARNDVDHNQGAENLLVEHVQPVLGHLPIRRSYARDSDPAASEARARPGAVSCGAGGHRVDVGGGVLGGGAHVEHHDLTGPGPAQELGGWSAPVPKNAPRARRAGPAPSGCLPRCRRRVRRRGCRRAR